MKNGLFVQFGSQWAASGILSAAILLGGAPLRTHAQQNATAPPATAPSNAPPSKAPPSGALPSAEPGSSPRSDATDRVGLDPSDPDPLAAQQIAEQTAAREAVTLWAGRLSRDNPAALRTLAANSLAMLLTTENASDEVVRSLTDNVGDPEAAKHTRFAAANALGKIRSPKALDAMLALMSDRDASEPLRAAICDSLSEIGVRVSDADALISHLEDRRFHSPLVRSLTQLGGAALPQLVKTLESNRNPGVREGIAKVFAWLSLPQFRPIEFPLEPEYLIGLLTGPTETDVFRRNIASTIANIGKPGVPFLVSKLAAGVNDNTRVRVAKILGEIGPDALSSGEALLSMLLERDSPVWVHDVAAEAIEKIGAPMEATVDLLSALGHVDTATSESVIRAATRNGPARLPILITVLSDPDVDPAVKLGALEAVYIIGTESKSTVGVDGIVHVLEIALAEEDRDVAIYALSLLGRLGREAVIALPQINRLKAASQDNKLLRRAIDRTLNQIGPGPATP